MLCGLTKPNPYSSGPDLLDEILATPTTIATLEALSEDELKERYTALQGKVQDSKVDWYVIPSEDEHQSEEVALKDKRREWLTGFTGSAGTALIPASSDSQAILFVDPRYSIQARQEVVKGLWEVRDVQTGQGSTGWIGWAINELPEGVRIGLDPRLISSRSATALEKALSRSGAKLVALETNLIDQMRATPPSPRNPITHHPIKFSGESTASKLKRVRAAISSPPSSINNIVPGIALRNTFRKSPYVYLLPSLPTIAWLLNFRCDGDIPYCPTTFAYVAITAEECVVFVDGDRVDEETREDWKDAGVEIRKYSVKEVGEWVKGYADLVRSKFENEKDKEEVRLLGAPECSWALRRACEPSTLEIVTCPVQPLQALKNPVEQAGMRAAYLRDGRAYVRWISFLEGKILKEKRDIGEWAAAMALGRFRRSEEHFAGLAYEDISGSGPNGAIPHYAPQRGKDRIIDPDTTYVIDSGAQYLDGTIDTTRTLYFGDKPSDEIKRAYTRVLQGHMAVSMATFPRGMRGDWFNMAARGPLYEDKLDFGHGLGHGVGSYMGVHEYPVSYPHDFSFQPGHVTTIEPGYYKAGDFGVRIESLLLCREKQEEPPKEDPKDPDQEKSRSVDTPKDNKWLEWERLTQVPIQTSLVDWTLTTKDQIRWLNDHNTAVEAALMPLLDGDGDADARDWLKRACKPKKIWPWTGA